MKLLLYVLGGFVSVVLGVLLMLRYQPEQNPLTMFAFIVLFAIAPLGGFWMAYMSIRYEKKPLPLIALALFVPFTFLWYYFECVRPGKLTKPHGPIGES